MQPVLRHLRDDEIQALLENDLTDAYCDLDQVFDDVTLLRGSTASATSQVIVSIKPTEINTLLQLYAAKRQSQGQSPKAFIKFMIHSEYSQNRPEVEIAIYKYLDQMLLRPHVTPHIMAYVASAHCPEMKNHLEWMTPAQQDEEVMRWYKNDDSVYDLPGAYGQSITPEFLKKNALTSGKVLIMELGEGDSLFKVLTQKTLTHLDFYGLMFQVGYTLQQMHRVGVRHNDLHTGNIWVDILPTPRTLRYQLPDESYAEITTRYIAKIYDFDLSSFTTRIKEVILNEKLRDHHCPDYGMCDTPDPLYDWTTMMHNVYEMSLMPRIYRHLPLRDWVSSVVLDTSLYTDESNFEFPGRYCAKLKDGTCHPQGRVPSNMILSFWKVYQHRTYFDPFKVDDKVGDAWIATPDVPIYRSFS